MSEYLLALQVLLWHTESPFFVVKCLAVILTVVSSLLIIFAFITSTLM